MGGLMERPGEDGTFGEPSAVRAVPAVASSPAFAA